MTAYIASRKSTGTPGFCFDHTYTWTALFNFHTVLKSAQTGKKFSLFSLCLLHQGSRFEVSAVGSLCLPKLVYYTSSAFHSKHVLMHLSNSHQLHIKTRDAVRSIQELENIGGQGWCCISTVNYLPTIKRLKASLFYLLAAGQFYKEAYICDPTHLKHRLQTLTCSMSDCSVATEETTAWFRGEEEGNSFFCWCSYILWPETEVLCSMCLRQTWSCGWTNRRSY